MENKIAKYLDENHVTIYADYNDELSDDMVNYLLQGDLEAFGEAMFEIECNVFDYEHYKGMLEELELEDSDEVRNIFNQYVVYDFSYFWRSCMRNTRVKAVATPVKRNGEEIEFPGYDFDKEYNRQLQSYHKRGMDGKPKH